MPMLNAVKFSMKMLDDQQEHEQERVMHPSSIHLQHSFSVDNDYARASTLLNFT